MQRTIYYLFGLLVMAGMLSACGEKPAERVSPPLVLRGIGVGVDEMETRMGRYDSLENLLSIGIFGYSTGTDPFDPTPATSTHTPNLFNNAQATRTVTKEGTTSILSEWSYSPVALWPRDTDVNNTFFAYAPYMESGQKVGTDGYFEVEATTGAPVLKFRPPQNVSEQVDLLYSELNNNVSNINVETNDGEVLYRMKHAMLWVRFVIATRDMNGNGGADGEFYTITEFRFIGGHIMAAAAFDLGTATWKPDPAFAGTNDGYEGAVYEFDYLYDHPLEVKAGEVTRLGASLNRSYLMMIPDNFVTDTNETSVEISFLHYPGEKAVEGEAYESEHFVSIPFPDVKMGEPGNTLVYVVRVSTSGTYIEFKGSSTIQEWLEDGTSYEEEVF
jgi:hypothetical protein